MTFHIITIFPQIFESYFNESIIRRAAGKGFLKIKIYDLRDWTKDKHRTVDGRPYGGGPGMIMLAEPVIKAIKEIKQKIGRSKSPKAKTVLFSPGGKSWDQAKARKYSKFNDLILVCGRYEGVDARAAKFVDEEISIGQFVLTGGEIPAMVVVDSIARLIPGVLGNSQSILDESYSQDELEYPQYSRPEILNIRGRKYEVPKILLSGNHAEIEKWKKSKKKKNK